MRRLQNKRQKRDVAAGLKFVGSQIKRLYIILLLPYRCILKRGSRSRRGNCNVFSRIQRVYILMFGFVYS